MLEGQTEREYILEEYRGGKSTSAIGKAMNKNSNYIRRKLISYGEHIRNHSEAQLLMTAQGLCIPCKKGSKRDESVKKKIGQGQTDRWANMPEEKRAEIAAKAKESWEETPYEEREAFLKKGTRAIREAAKIGSKLEIYLNDELNKLGFKCIAHRENVITGNSYQLDLYFPELATCCEVDGVSHFEPCWGEEAFARQQIADQTKNGLLLSAGLVVIRLANKKKSMSKTYMAKCLSLLLAKLTEIKNKFPAEGNRLIHLDPEV